MKQYTSRAQTMLDQLIKALKKLGYTVRVLKLNGRWWIDGFRGERCAPLFRFVCSVTVRT